MIGSACKMDGRADEDTSSAITSQILSDSNGTEQPHHRRDSSKDSYAMATVRPKLRQTNRHPRFANGCRTMPQARCFNIKRQPQSKRTVVKVDSSTNTDDTLVDVSELVSNGVPRKAQPIERTPPFSTTNGTSSSLDVSSADCRAVESDRKTDAATDDVDAVNRAGLRANTNGKGQLENGSLNDDETNPSEHKIHVDSDVQPAPARPVSPPSPSYSQPNRPFAGIHYWYDETRPNTVHNAGGSARLAGWFAKTQLSDPCVSCTARDLLQCQLSMSDFCFPDICHEEQRKAVPFMARAYPESVWSDTHHVRADDGAQDQRRATNGRRTGVYVTRRVVDSHRSERTANSRSRYSRMVALGLPRVTFDIDETASQPRRAQAGEVRDAACAEPETTASEWSSSYVSDRNTAGPDTTPQPCKVSTPARFGEYWHGSDCLLDTASNKTFARAETTLEISGLTKKLGHPTNARKKSLADAMQASCPNKYGLVIDINVANVLTPKAGSVRSSNKSVSFYRGHTNPVNRHTDYRPPTSRYKYRATERNSIYESTI